MRDEGGGVVIVPSVAGETRKLLARDIGVASPSYGSRLDGDVQGGEDVGEAGGDTTPQTDRDRRRSLFSPSLQKRTKYNIISTGGFTRRHAW